jgi:hypothetical protein
MSKLSMWAIVHNSGEFEQVYSAKRPRQKGAKVRQLERFGDLSVEVFHLRKGWIARPKSDLANKVDAAYDANFPFARLLDYVVKEIEARVILGTLLTEGRIAKEAILRDVSVEDLAKSVLARADSQQPWLDKAAEKLGVLEND